jgi:release factor glutamine methyltransferase
MPTSIADAILRGTNTLRKAGVTEARREAGSLVAHVLNRDRSFIIGHAEDLISAEQLELFRMATERRAKGEPLQYITGHQEFFGLDFEVTGDVLIPRPETELIIETALTLTNSRDRPLLICDVGTGSGCIAVTLLHELPRARAVAIDISPAAIGVAKRNAERNSVSNRIDFVVSDCFAVLQTATPSSPLFDLIVSNPPYIALGEFEGLQREVRNFEPRSALAAGIDGLTVIRRLLKEAPAYCKAGGHFLFEIGFEQSVAVENLISTMSAWNLLAIHKDLQGIPRTVALEKLP